LEGIFLTQPNPTFVSALPGENTTSEMSLFLSNAIWLLN